MPTKRPETEALGLECATSKPGTSVGWIEMAEAAVDAVLADVGTPAAPTIFTSKHGTIVKGSCAVIFFPDGFTSVGTDLSSGGC